MEKKKNKGFSLIELIIAIAILVILTGLLAPQFMKYIEKSREAKDMQTLDTVYTAVQGALADEEAYKDALSKLENKRLQGPLSGIPEGAFKNELISLLGTDEFDAASDTTKLKLNSKKATKDGVICVAIVFKEGTAGTAGDDNTYGGVEVTVYCGKSDGSKIDGLDVVGAPYTAKTAENN